MTLSPVLASFAAAQLITNRSAPLETVARSHALLVDATASSAAENQETWTVMDESRNHGQVEADETDEEAGIVDTFFSAPAESETTFTRLMLGRRKSNDQRYFLHLPTLSGPLVWQGETALLASHHTPLPTVHPEPARIINSFLLVDFR